MVETPTIAAEAEKTKPKLTTSKGEWAFDMATYYGIGGIITFAAGIPLGYWSKYGGGAEKFAKAGKHLEKLGLSPANAVHTLMAIVLWMPGTAALLPIKLLEDKKPELVAKLNKMLGDKSEDISVHEEPKQTWGSLFIGRIAAAIAVLTGFTGAGQIMGNDKFEAFERKFSEHIVCKPLGYKTHVPLIEKGIQVMENGLPKMVESKAFRYGKIAALDLFATAAAATLLYIGSKIIAGYHTKDRWHAAGKETKEEDKRELLAASGLPEDTGKLYSKAVMPKAKESYRDSLTQERSTAAETPLGIGA
jgi:hypothetical protein